MKSTFELLNRRRFIRDSAALGLLAGLSRIVPGYAFESTGLKGRSIGASEINGIDLLVRKETIKFGERQGTAVTINGTVPGPLVRLREGRDALLRVTNGLEEDTSIHWHGLLLPPGMDGVPGVSFAGIKAGETFTYRFPVRQNGTYWYHSHSGFQEQEGHYGPLIIDAAEPEPFHYDREHVVLLSDWTSEDSMRMLARLKRRPNYYNFQRRTVGTFFDDVTANGLKSTVADRLAWGGMRMDPSDIADVTGSTYTFLMNGFAPDANWTALFHPGERVRLRFINAGAGTYFDVRIPGLPMTVVSVDGQHVQPIVVDEIRIAIAETYDVIVVPKEARAHTIFAEAMDRSGFARGSLATEPGMAASIPPRRKRAVASMADMGMGEMSGMQGMQGMSEAVPAAGADNTADMAEPQTGMEGMNMAPPAANAMPGMPGMTMPDKRIDAAPMDDPKVKSAPFKHGPATHGSANAAVPVETKSRFDEPGIGLENSERRVLRYSDLRSLQPGEDHRAPGREIELHLTGNMERYMWGFDGKKFSEAGPIGIYFGERVRLTLVNDTMMNHPIHLHGMFMELDNGAGLLKPKKHTVNVKPAERLSLEITADALGHWALHCHILLHMELGMFRVVSVVEKDGGVHS